MSVRGRGYHTLHHDRDGRILESEKNFEMRRMHRNSHDQQPTVVKPTILLQQCIATAPCKSSDKSVFRCCRLSRVRHVLFCLLVELKKLLLISTSRTDKRNSVFAITLFFEDQTISYQYWNSLRVRR